MDDDRREGSPDRRNGPGWRDLNEAMHELREEFREDINKVEETMAEGFDRVDRRIVWAVTVIATLLGLGLTTIALMK